MGVRGSIGRGTRVKHSTGHEWEDLEKAKKKYPRRIRYSTGESSPILHATGTEMDTRALRDLRGESVEEEAAEEESAQKARLHSIPAKAGEDTKYLELYLESKRRNVPAQRGGLREERDKPVKAKEGDKKEVSQEKFKAIPLDY